MKIKCLVRDKVFIPEFEGNKDLPKAEQIIVNIKRFPTITEIRNITFYKFDDDGSGKVHYDDDYALKTFIGEITGIELSEGFTPVKDGESLAKSNYLELNRLAVEIRSYLLNVSEVITEKEK